MHTLDEYSNEEQCQIRFISDDQRLASIPANPISVPIKINPAELNELANVSAQSVKSLDFLVNDILLRVPLLEFLQTNNLSAESVLEITCLLKESAPIPDRSLQDDDWVADVATNSHLQVLNCNFKIFSVFSANYSGLVTAWSHKGNKLASHHVSDESLRTIHFFSQSNQNYIAYGGESQSVIISELNSSTKKTEINPAMVLRGHERSVECVSSNADGTRLVSGSFDKSLKIWDISDESTDYVNSADEKPSKRQKKLLVTKVPLITLQSHKDAVVDVGWDASDDNHVVTASWDQSLILWDLSLSGVANSLTSDKAFRALSIHPSSGSIVTASMDHIIRLWDFRSRGEQSLIRRFSGHASIVSDVCWSPTNENLFVSSSFDQIVKMWDVRSHNAPLFDVTGHEGHVLAVSWSVDRLIASAGKDCTVKTYRRE